ncbi:MAG: YciK family oxidoreductase [Pseudomonadota bacterium]
MQTLSAALAESYPELAEAATHWRAQFEPDTLRNHNIVVTGAGAGIGATAARTLASFGANIILLGRSRQPLEQVFDWIEQHTQTQPVIVPCDLEQLTDTAVAELAEQIDSAYGSLHGLLHNASMLGPKVPLPHYPAADWQRVMQTNVNAPFLLNAGLFDLLDKSENACVVHTSSTVGRQGRAYWGAYAASKFALEGVSQILADETENAGRIRVYSLNPGGTRTRMRAQAYPGEDPQTLPVAEQHMDLYLYLFEGPRTGKVLPPTGSQLDARTWQGGG